MSREDLPRQERGVTPQMVGRYPRFDVLAQVSHWDDVTRRVVLARVEDIPPIRFFSDAEARTLGAFCDVVTAQDADPRIPVLNFIDAKLHAGRRDGWRYYDVPDDDALWRVVARALDQEAGTYGAYAEAPHDVQSGIVHRFSKGQLHGGEWDAVNVARAFKVVMRYVVQAFYAHPWAWNEIGFGGPAYPRGYGTFGSPHLGEREPWEAEEAVDTDPVPDVKRRELD